MTEDHGNGLKLAVVAEKRGDSKAPCANALRKLDGEDHAACALTTRSLAGDEPA